MSKENPSLLSHPNLSRPTVSSDVTITDLNALNLKDLHQLAEALDITRFKPLKKKDLVDALLHPKHGLTIRNVNGILEIMPDGFGFLRPENYFPSQTDIYLSQTQIKRFGLRVGDRISGISRTAKADERYCAMLYIQTINWGPADESTPRPCFSSLTPIYPKQRLQLEVGATPLSGRLLDLMAPIGHGQRALIVSPPKAGKTTIMKDIANAISRNHPDTIMKVLLIDERPEEVTDMQRSISGEVIYSTFDEPPEHHVRISELVLESAKRLVECGHDVVILLDSITRLARAYNLVVSPSGRTLSGGLDPSSLHKPKRFFGGARTIENGGSLTIIATALVDTGSRMDDIIYEEFKGTGNMELHLDRRYANRRLFPAVDIINSGTRKEDLLLDDVTLKKTYLLRKHIDADTGLEDFIKLLKQTQSNDEFLQSSLFSALH